MHLAKLLKALQGAELGAVTTNRTTHRNVEHCSGYDTAHGWVRSPAMSRMHYYLACHPTVYAFFVATIACELLHQHRRRVLEPVALFAQLLELVA